MMGKAVLAVFLSSLPFLQLEAEGPPRAAPPANHEFTEVALPKSNKVEGLTLSPDQKVPAGKPFAIVQATTAKPEQKVKWLVLGSGAPPSAVVSPSGKSVMVFLGGQADQIVVLAYSATEKGPTEPAVCKITVEGKAATPAERGPAGRPPPATPRPRPLTGRMHLTLVVDFGKQTPELAALRASTALRGALTRAGCDFHEFNASQAPADMQKLLQAEGLAPPAAIVQDQEGNVREVAPVTTAEALLALVERARKGQ
jgi:hypothetical protein